MTYNIGVAKFVAHVRYNRMECNPRVQNDNAKLNVDGSCKT